MHALCEAVAPVYTLSLMLLLLSRSHIGEEGRASLLGGLGKAAKDQLERQRAKDVMWEPDKAYDSVGLQFTIVEK